MADAGYEIADPDMVGTYLLTLSAERDYGTDRMAEIEHEIAKHDVYCYERHVLDQRLKVEAEVLERWVENGILPSELWSGPPTAVGDQ